MDRRDFLKQAGATSLAIAGTALGAAWLYDPRSGADFFRESKVADAKILPSF
ncbi:MAG: twin-arginine translocation signal domain-containing protein, partial [Candidatus Latescibacterota bacterium]